MPTSQLVLATGNRGKLDEFNQLLADFPVTVIAQTEFNVPEAVENGLTFVENAIIKARHATQHTGLAAIADDSGLEVDALQGAPGIYSARYAGLKGDAAANNRKLLAALEGYAEAKRSARFRAVIVYMRHAHDPAPVIAEGVWEGRILQATRGERGFGYDPLFYVPTHDCSAAELEPSEKNRISHRGQALQRLLAVFANGRAQLG